VADRGERPTQDQNSQDYIYKEAVRLSEQWRSQQENLARGWRRVLAAVIVKHGGQILVDDTTQESIGPNDSVVVVREEAECATVYRLERR
jgi:hypothetical protein